MACKVFGSPVTNETVRKTRPHVSKITTKDRAEAALLCMNADGILEKVKDFTQKLTPAPGLERSTSTVVIMYNGTGDDMTFNLRHNWKGQMLTSYPQQIQNGQWVVFQHVGTRSASKEAVVYSGTNFDDTPCDWMLSWHTTQGTSGNHVYTEIREEGHYQTVDWDCIENMLDQQTNFHTDSWNGCCSSMTISKGIDAKVRAIMTLDESSLPPTLMAMARDVSNSL